jgi:hypothetical protein
MKIKKFSKKLVLNKKTISNLTNKEMQDAYGGYKTWWITCVLPDPTLSKLPC